MAVDQRLRVRGETRSLLLPISRVRGAYLTLVVLVLLSFLLLYSTRAAQQTRDSLVYAYSAQTGTELFHPHHLLYSPAIYVLLQLLQPFCAECDAVVAGQLHNVLWAVVGVGAFFLLVRQLGHRRLMLPVTAALLLLTTRGYWELSTQTTMYVPAAALLALMAVILPVKEEPGHVRTAALAMLLALAVLYHQSNVLFVLPLACYLMASARKRGARVWLTVVGLAGGTVLVAYVLVFRSVYNSWSVPAFIRFCLSYTSEICLGGECKASPEQWGAISNLTADGFMALLNSLLWNYVLIPDKLVVTGSLLFGAALVVLTAWHLLQVNRRADHANVRIFALLWLFTYMLFFLWWLPTYQHPLVSTVVPTLLLLLLALHDVVGWSAGRLQRPALILVTSLFLLLAARNFQARIYPLWASTGDSYEEAEAVLAQVPKDCTFLTSYHVWNHLRYYFGVQTAIQAKHPMSFFYLGEALPAHYQLDRERCIAVESHYLMPDYVNEDYVATGSSAYSAPLRWLAYIGWLFDFEYDEQQDVVASRDYTVLQLPDGQRYLLLSASRRPVRGLGDLFRHLDADLGQSPGPFQTWLTSTAIGSD